MDGKTLGTVEDPASPLRSAVPRVPRYRLIGTDGPAESLRVTTAEERCWIGSHASNDVVLNHPTISRFHCEIVQDEHGARIRDLGSRNGTVVDGVVVLDGRLREGSVIRLGPAALSWFSAGDSEPMRLSEATELGMLVGASIPMRAAFELLERAAASDIGVLLHGETGTGKELAARAVHETGARRQRPFVVVDCSTLVPQLIESQLFGHERGAFTGARERKIGAFEAADGGTLFLDEIGEVPMELQPKLLRVLEARTVRRLGGTDDRPVDVRVLAATHRDLRREVNEKRFRADLFFRIAVMQVRIPPLRERAGDISLLCRVLLRRLGAPEEAAAELLSPASLSRLQRAAWPGNVRELRNYLERALVLPDPPPIDDPANAAPVAGSFDPGLTFAEALRKLLESFEPAYLRSLLDHHHGSVARAAEAAGMDRTHLYRLLRKHGVTW